MLGVQELSTFPGKGDCLNNWMVRIIRVITVDFTEVSKFPRKSWGAVHAQTVHTRHSLQYFELAPGNKATFYCGDTCIIPQKLRPIASGNRKIALKCQF